MWQREYSTLTDVPASRLWAVIADISNWATWDEDIEFTRINGLVATGNEFALKPKGAPSVTLKIEELTPPQKFVDVTQFPLAKMRTVHEFITMPAGTKILVTIQIDGLLGFLWRKIVGQGQVDGLPKQTLQFIQYARQQST